MSFNIRFDNPNEQPQDKWDVRKETCAEIIKKWVKAGYHYFN